MTLFRSPPHNSIVDEWFERFSGKAMGFDRRTYNDEVTLRYVPALRPNVLLIR